MKKAISPAALRRQAEAIVAQQGKSAPAAAGKTGAEVHELLVHQVELEMQNEELRLLQQSLEESRARYFDLFDLAPVGYLVLNESGSILEANLTAANELGMPRASLVDSAFTRLIHRDDQDIFHLARKELLATAEPQVFRLRLVKPDGAALWARLEATVSRAGDAPPAMRISFSDISDSVRLREELVEREQEYRLLAENASDVVMRCSRDGIIEWITPSVTTMANWSPAELVGRPFREIVHPDDWSRLNAAQDQLKQGVGFEIEARIHLQDDGWKWFAVRLRPALDARGRVVHHVGGWHDIQIEVQTREALAAERVRLRSFFDSLIDPHAVIEAVRDGRQEIVDFVLTDTNDAACGFFHAERSSIVGRRLLQLFPAASRPSLLAFCCEAFGTDCTVVANDFALPAGERGGEVRLDLRAVRFGNSLRLTWRDVTDRFLAAENLSASEQKFRLLALNSSDVVIHLGASGETLWVSPSLTTLLGWECADWMDRPLGEFFVDRAEADSLLAALGKIEQGGPPQLVRARLLAKDGGTHWVALHGNVYRNASGAFDGFSVSFHIIDKEVEFEQDLQRRARTDELTQLLNREEALTRLEQIRCHESRSGSLVAVLFCDLDNLKVINDTRGHAAGDEVLRVMAGRLRSCLRGNDDLGARVGGDEMLVVLRGVRNMDDAVSVAEKLRKLALKPVDLPSGEPFAASLSIGVALAQSDESTDSLIARADKAMYQSKQSGRNRVVAVAPVARRTGRRPVARG